MSSNTTTKKVSFGTPEQRGNVTVYPALPAEMLRAAGREKLRTAAYVRVSTDSIEQEGSLILQREYYEQHIKSNPRYEFAGVYEDDGITGTNTDRRNGFKKLMEDCRAGKIDLILVKSISRFARNVGDFSSTIDMLKALNPPVEVRFETEGLSTLGVSSEMFLMILSAMAQWESQNKSESITWAIDRLFAQGKYYVPAVLGFDKEKGRDKPLTINEEEAKTVKLCFALTIWGSSFADTATIMNALGLKSKPGNVNWTAAGVINLLSNEKYAGHIRARKTVTRNYKTHKVKKNEGEKPQYFHEGHHAAIVPPLAYEVARRIMTNRRGNSNGIPSLKAVPKGALKGFISVNKYLRGYTLADYEEASRSVYKKEENPQVSIRADKASIFDLRTYDIVSTISFEDRTKPSCCIQGSKISFNSACNKTLLGEKAELLFHPLKGILALRSSTKKNAFAADVKGLYAKKAMHISQFVPIALEAADLAPGYRYRIYGTKRTKKNECIQLFDLRNAEIVPSEKDAYILPDKFADRYGDSYYENLAACDLHRIDIDGLWQALQESCPTGSLAGDIIELTEFCQQSLAEFELPDNPNHE